MFDEARSSAYKYESAINEKYDTTAPILTIIICCYYRLDLIEKSVKSVLQQDYKNIELILIDNAAHSDVKKYLIDLFENLINTALITFEVNQFDWNDVCKQVAVCWNVALLHAKGDYICHLGYDDLISSNYASRMVRLFVENPECVTAAPMPYSINALGEVQDSKWLHDLNTRGRYTVGSDLGIDCITGSPRKLFAASGEIFVIKRDALLRYGGYDRIVDTSQVLKYAILGVSGFDPEAVLYWRHHSWQLNKQATNKGVIFYSSNAKTWKDSGIIELWRDRFSSDRIKALLDFKERSLLDGVWSVVLGNVRQKNLGAVLFSLYSIIRQCPSLLPQISYRVLRELYLMVLEKTYRWVHLFDKNSHRESGDQR